jgi:hypothetical protein
LQSREVLNRFCKDLKGHCLAGRYHRSPPYKERIWCCQLPLLSDLPPRSPLVSYLSEFPACRDLSGGAWPTDAPLVGE